jgi:hypothetical protein
VSSEASFPWYDSHWLQSYAQAKAIIAKTCPGRLSEFEATLSVLRAPDDFRVKHIKDLLSPDALHRALEIVAALKTTDLEQHEMFRFGRAVVHNQPELTELQHALTNQVAELVGEDIEPSYNFLSLYNNLGVCEPHMDAPSAKWTLDLCLDQSEPWPISFSQVRPWPEEFQFQGDDWQQKILNNPELQFDTFAPQVNEALLFAGSNQWHYRERIARTRPQNFCHLLFFHYIPKGCGELIDPGNWRDIFDIPELAVLSPLPLRD